MAARSKRQQDLEWFLPDGMLEDVLRCVAPRDVAASRCVSQAWRAVVDAGRLLRADLLPLKLGGIFVSSVDDDDDSPSLLARPSAGPTISGWPDALPSRQAWGDLKDHCNGLLLLGDAVVNPATRWWAPLPARTGGEPSEVHHGYSVKHLAYDPAASPHFEVLEFPCFYYANVLNLDRRYGAHPEIEQSEWPPSIYNLQVFSSSTGQWKGWSFVREGEAAGTLADLRLACPSQYLRHYTVYLRGALYVYCQFDFVMRISLSNNKYQVIKSPTCASKCLDFHLGRSRKGVYFASLDPQCWIQVWRLKESCGQMEWVFIHYRDLKRMVPRPNYNQQIDGSWILQGINYDEHDKPVYPNNKDDEELGWNSDDDNTLNYEEKVGVYGRRRMSILGFHPYKEVVFLSESSARVIAYHLNGWKVQDLGNLHPTEYDDLNREWPSIRVSFPYTPCWM